jgi:hypothetical protein
MDGRDQPFMPLKQAVVIALVMTAVVMGLGYIIHILGG